MLFSSWLSVVGFRFLRLDLAPFLDPGRRSFVRRDEVSGLLRASEAAPEFEEATPEVSVVEREAGVEGVLIVLGLSVWLITDDF